MSVILLVDAKKMFHLLCLLCLDNLQFKKVTKFHLNVFAIFLERTTVEKEERDYAKQGNNRLP